MKMFRNAYVTDLQLTNSDKNAVESGATVSIEEAAKAGKF